MPIDKKAILILDNIVAPERVKRTMSIGHTFNHQDSTICHVGRKKIMTEELLAAANVLNNYEEIGVGHQFELDTGIDAIICDIKNKSSKRQ